MDWLPANAFTEKASKNALEGLVEAWARRWFADAQISITNASLTSAGFIPVSVYWSEAGKKHVLDAALKINVGVQSLTDSDRAVLDAFARMIVEDLLGVFQESGQPNSVDDRVVRATLAINQVEVMTMILPRNRLASAIKAQSPRSKPPAKQLSSRMKAIGSAKVQLEGVLGHADVALSEVETLAAGDVLILNRALAQNVEIRLKGFSRPVGRGRLGRNTDRISIQF